MTIQFLVHRPSSPTRPLCDQRITLGTCAGYLGAVYCRAVLARRAAASFQLQAASSEQYADSFIVPLDAESS